MESKTNIEYAEKKLFKIGLAQKTANPKYLVFIGEDKKVYIGLKKYYNPTIQVYDNSNGNLIFLYNHLEYSYAYPFFTYKEPFSVGYKDRTIKKYNVPRADFDKYDEIIEKLKIEGINLPNIFDNSETKEKSKKNRDKSVR